MASDGLVGAGTVLTAMLTAMRTERRGQQTRRRVDVDVTAPRPLTLDRDAARHSRLLRVGGDILRQTLDERALPCQSGETPGRPRVQGVVAGRVFRNRVTLRS